MKEMNEEIMGFTDEFGESSLCDINLKKITHMSFFPLYFAIKKTIHSLMYLTILLKNNLEI